MEMAKNRLSQVVVLILMALNLLHAGKSGAQTSGTLTFSVTTTEPAGGYTGKHVLAVWLKDASGNFIKTKIKYASVRQQYLNAWVSNSGTNVVDAVTGATLTAHGTRTFTWDGTSTSSSPVADGVYSVWMQMADANTNGATAYVPFTKGTSGVTLSPTDNGNFTNMSLKWSPVITSVSSGTGEPGFNVYPSPATGLINITVPESHGEVKVVVLNIAGTAVLSKRVLSPEGNRIRVDLGGLINGLYLVDVVSGGKTYCSKIILNR